MKKETLSTKVKSNSSKEKKKGSWRKEETINGYTTGIEVREVENGYIIRKFEWGRITENGDYKDSNKEYVSSKNPLEGDPKAVKLEEVSLEKDIVNSIKKMFE